MPEFVGDTEPTPGRQLTLRDANSRGIADHDDACRSQAQSFFYDANLLGIGYLCLADLLRVDNAIAVEETDRCSLSRAQLQIKRPQHS